MDYIKAIENRRSVYAIGNKVVVSPAEIEAMIGKIIQNAPSPMHVQSNRAVVLFGQSHLKLWDIVKGALQKIVPPQQFAKTERKINAFAAGYGTVLFFQDKQDIVELEQQMPLYKDHVTSWTLQSNAMLQFAVWTGLESLGLGASLQHYNPLIDAEVMTEFKLPSTWSLVSQMPFGNMVQPADAKENKPLSQIMLVKK